jgi:hypothetical protein
MKAASKLLVMFLVLGFVSKAGARDRIDRNCTLIIARQQIGFLDLRSPVTNRARTEIHLGPLGNREVPFTATQGLVGFCCILALLVIVPVLLTVRWKKRAQN